MDDMIDEAAGRIDYDETGAGPTILLVPGSCSTGAVWRPVIADWDGRYRCVTTSLLGYGGTAERRTAHDPGIEHEAAVVESVVRKASGCVHLVGHSFGGVVALAVALRRQVPLASLTVVEAPVAQLLRERAEHRHYQAFRDMTEAYFAAFHDGDADAIATMIDFYGGAGTFASWPAKARAYAVQTTPVNILDWASFYGLPLSAASLSTIDIPVRIVVGGASPPAVQRANALLGECIRGAALATIEGATHFMIATHADQVAGLIAEHVHGVEAASAPRAGTLDAAPAR
jgi:pimeloyl-ACP methyl ester carboxylesterase